MTTIKLTDDDALRAFSYRPDDGIAVFELADGGKLEISTKMLWHLHQSFDRITDYLGCDESVAASPAKLDQLFN